MKARRTYRVAGHTFSLVADEERMSRLKLGNYSPFIATDGEDIFCIELVDPFETSGKETLYLSSPESGEQRIDLYSIDGGYLFGMAPEGNMPKTNAV